MAKKKQPSGWDKTRYLGKKTVLLTMTPEQLALIRAAAAAEMRPVTQFFMFHAIKAAQGIAVGHDDQADDNDNTNGKGD